MTYGLILVKGVPQRREITRALLEGLAGNDDFRRSTGVEIEKVLISFGWPDFILLMKSDNVELIKHAIVTIRDRAAASGDNVETSTIICVTQEEIDKKIGEWANRSTS